MASPATCGLLAARLSQSPDYLGLPRDITRSNMARNILQQACRDIGMNTIFEGRGVPSL